MSCLSVCLDLGSSSLKIGFGIRVNGGIRYGKITEEAPFPPSFFPSSACYDTVRGSWIFGSDVDRRSGSSFSTVVKIKELLSLLLPKGKEDKVPEENRNAYYNGKRFPKFLFPQLPDVKKKGNDIRYLIGIDKYTFETPLTLQQVCEKFFEYVAGLVNSSIPRIAEKYGIAEAKLRDYSVALIYPFGARTEYIREYVRLVEHAFGVYGIRKVELRVSSTRALAYYARSQGKVKDGDEFLVFDIGGEMISVSKAALSGEDTLIDGIDGHSEPKIIGGNDIDKNVIRLIESKIERRETIGTPSYGEPGHVSEEGQIENNYLLTKEVNDAKVLLSSDDAMLRRKRSAPINVIREVCLRVDLTREELDRCSGVQASKGFDHVADKLVDYVVNEATLVSNQHVTKILIAGGVVETAMLFDYLKENVCARCPKILKKNFMTFERKVNENDPLGISEAEDSSYAAALGGCYLSLEKIPIRICLPLTFAVNYAIKGTDIVYARVYPGAEKGKQLQEKITQFKLKGSVKEASLNDSQHQCIEVIYSIQLSLDDIRNRRIEGVEYCRPLSRGYDLVVRHGIQNPIQESLKTKTGLDVILSNRISLSYKGKYIHTFEPYDDDKSYSFVEGIQVDEDGRATIFIERDIVIDFADKDKLNIPVAVGN